jgi:Protein of unknown function (DUF1552)
MTSYRFARRSFLSWTGAAFGLHTALRSTEAGAQGMTSPARLLLTQHPTGTVRPAWLPQGAGTTFTFSEILKPFETAGLRGDMIVIDGLNMDLVPGPGQAHTKGSVSMVTGAPTKWFRPTAGDPMAAGPSIDQLLLAKAKGLQGTAFKSLQTLCDDRSDAPLAISMRCLTYDVATRPQTAAAGSYENIPILPTMKPLDLYTRVFGTMMPGGMTSDALLKARAKQKSVLDFSLRELAKLRTMAPAGQKAVLDAHESAIRDMEKELDGQGDATKCGNPTAPPDVVRVDDGKLRNDTSPQQSTQADNTQHQQIGEYHQAIIRAAFVCDMTRVATFQWSPGSNEVAFKGLNPGDPQGIYNHHPVSHNVSDAQVLEPVAANRTAFVQFLVNVEIWYNTRMADFLTTLKSTKDVFGNPLLDNTVVPYLTEVSIASHAHNPMPLAIFGGKNLGFKGGQFAAFKGRSYVDFLLTIIAGFGVTTADLAGQPILDSPHTVPLEGIRA